jgi:RNA polymerase sigma factor (sigma-70 family)
LLVFLGHELSKVQKQRDMEENEKELITRARAGSREAFDKLVRIYEDKMFSLAYRMTHDREAALDLTQETFFTAFKEIRRFRGEASFSTWIYRIASNKAINYMRRKSLLSFLSLEKTAPTEASYEMADNTQTQELGRAMTEAIAALPPKQKLVFNLRFYEELPFAEIADVTGKSVSTVKTSYQKAVEKLRKRLKEFR